MIVRIEKDWNFPDIMRQTPSGSGVWEGIQFTEKNITECDVLIVLNRPHRNIFAKVKKGGAWLFSQESPIPIYEWHKKSFKHFDKVYTFWENENRSIIVHDQTSLPWHINKSYDELKKLLPGTSKLNEISWVTSNASAKEGHKLRISLIEFLQNEKFPFHLFGRGFHPIDDKFDGIFPYKYSIAVENFSCNDYWTEKIADCLLSWTLPFYFGSKNILDYFPEESMILIDPSDPFKAMKIMQNAIENNEWEKRLPAIEKARNLILDKYQFFPAVVSKIRAAKLAESSKRVLIPGNLNGKVNVLPLGLKFKTSFANMLGL